MKYKKLTAFSASLYLLFNVSNAIASKIDSIEFDGAHRGVKPRKAHPGLIVIGQDIHAHYQIKSRPVPVPPRYSVHYELEVGTDPLGTNSTPVGVGILSGDESVWVKNPLENTYNCQLGLQQGDIEVNGNQTHSVLVFTNQGAGTAYANFKVRSVRFIDPVNNVILSPKQHVYAPHYDTPWPQPKEGHDRKGYKADRDRSGRF